MPIFKNSDCEVLRIAADVESRRIRPLTPGNSDHYPRKYLPGNIRQSKVPPLKLVCQPGMVDSQAAEDGRLQVVYGNGVFDDVVTKVVRLAIDNSGFDA